MHKASVSLNQALNSYVCLLFIITHTKRILYTIQLYVCLCIINITILYALSCTVQMKIQQAAPIRLNFGCTLNTRCSDFYFLRLKRVFLFWKLNGIRRKRVSLLNRTLFYRVSDKIIIIITTRQKLLEKSKTRIMIILYLWHNVVLKLEKPSFKDFTRFFKYTHCVTVLYCIVSSI